MLVVKKVYGFGFRFMCCFRLSICAVMETTDTSRFCMCIAICFIVLQIQYYNLYCDTTSKFDSNGYVQYI